LNFFIANVAHNVGWIAKSSFGLSSARFDALFVLQVFNV